MKVNENYLKELQELANKSRLGNAKKYAKYSHLKSLYEWFEELATNWLDELTGFLETTVHATHAYKKRKIKCIRYLIHFGITSKEEIMKQIPKCPYCNKLYQLPNSIDNLKNAYVLTGHCGSEVCKNKYVYDQTSKSVQEKYGVDNISKLDYIQKKREETIKMKYGVRYLQQAKEIREKSISTLREKYGVDNISQLDSIKKKKAQTFEKNYGVDNIFKRNDLMSEYWLDKLNVPNPMYNEEHLMKFSHPRTYRRKIRLHGMDYLVLSDLEEEVLEKMHSWYDKQLLPFRFVKDITANELYLYDEKRVLQDKQLTWLSDICIGGWMYIELKKGLLTPLKDEIKKIFLLTKLQSKRSIIYMKGSTELLIYIFPYAKKVSITYKQESNTFLSVSEQIVQKYIKDIKTLYSSFNINVDDWKFSYKRVDSNVDMIDEVLFDIIKRSYSKFKELQ